MKLRKPPVIEAWIEFQFDVSEDTPLWTPDTAADFIKKQYGDEFTINAVAVETQITSRMGPQNQVRREGKDLFQYCRASNKNGDRALSVGRNLLGFNAVRSANAPWGGFEALRDNAMMALKIYSDAFSPLGLSRVGLHYRDFVRLPSDWPSVGLTNYFTFAPRLPEIMKQPDGFAMRLAFPCEGDALAALEMSLQRLSSGDPSVEPSAGVVLDWHHGSDRMGSDWQAQAADYLNAAHDRHLRVFRNAFTNVGWILFEPED